MPTSMMHVLLLFKLSKTDASNYMYTNYSAYPLRIYVDMHAAIMLIGEGSVMAAVCLLIPVAIRFR